MDRPVSVAALRCRTSDRTPGASRGAEALALALDPQARLVGEFGEPRQANWDDDLRDSHDCIVRAGALVDGMLADGSFPVLTSSDCSICLTTFPAVARHIPDVQVLWLDAHADSNTPETTISGFLGGMCLGAAVGHWDAGFPAALAPPDVVACGIRQVDPGEPVPEVVDPAEVPYALAGRSVYVHLDLDVLDPEVLPPQFVEPGGLSVEQLRSVVAEVAQAGEVVGIEVTAFEHPTPERVELVASIVRVLLP